MKHTYEKPVITVDAGMAEGVYAASGAPTTQIRKCSLLKTNNLPQAASHPDAASSFILSLLPPSPSLLFSSFSPPAVSGKTHSASPSTLLSARRARPSPDG